MTADRPAAFSIVIRSAVLGCVLFTSIVARAGNDDEMLLGNDAAMTGGAVSATVKDSSAIWYNPAGLGAVRRNQMDLSATAYTVRFYSAPRFISATTGESEDGSVTEFVTIPTQVGYARRIAPGTTIGLAYFAPHASNIVLREALDVGTPRDGSKWQLAATIADTQHVFAAAVGSALSPRVRIGGSLVAGYATTTQAVSLFGATQRNGATTSFVGQSVVGTASRMSLEAGLGVQLDLSRHVTLAINCRTPRLQLQETTDVSITGGMAALSDGPLLSADASNPSTSRADVHLLRAGRAGVAFSYRYDRGWVSAEVDAQPGLHHATEDTDRKAVVNARAGVYHALVPSFAVGAGLFTDRQGEVTINRLLNGFGDFYGGTLGVELSNEHLLAKTESAKSLVFSTNFAVRYAFSSAVFGRAVVDPGALARAEEPFRPESGTLRTHEIGLYVGGGVEF